MSQWCNYFWLITWWDDVCNEMMCVEIRLLTVVYGGSSSFCTQNFDLNYPREAQNQLNVFPKW